MAEKEQDIDPYWQEDILAGEGLIQRIVHAIHMRIHTSEERYSGGETIYKLKSTQRGQTLCDGQAPYSFKPPNITPTIATYPQPSTEGAIGEVFASEWRSTRH